jgi:hypothetical protein
MDYSDTDYLGNEPRTGRFVKNAFDQSESVALTQSHWKHFDWLATQGYNMDQWTAKLDIDRHGYEGFIISLETYIGMALVYDERRRFLAGEDVPLHINADGYLPEEEKPPHKQEIRRNVTDSTEATVTVQLPRGYWEYLDWLGNRGTDIAQYIIEADKLREQPNWKGRTLRGMLQILLLEDEKKRYFSDEPSPLFIRPEGYDE